MVINSFNKLSPAEADNKLSPAEAERLALLAEELGETMQAIGKILRHGYESSHPNGGPNNRYLLENECGDVQHAIDRLCIEGDLRRAEIHLRSNQTAINVVKYLHHQGRLDSGE